MLSSGVCGENSINDKPTYGLGWQASRLDAVSNMDLAGSDHTSRSRTYSSCCRQRPLLSRPHLLLLLPAETTHLATPTQNWVGMEMSEGGAKAGGGGMAKRTDDLAFCITRSSSHYTALLLGSCWVGMLALRSGGPTPLHPNP